MFRTAVLFAVALTLSVGSAAQADLMTTNGTLVIPGGSTIPGVQHIDAGVGAGRIFGNAAGTASGDAVHVVGATLWGQWSTAGGTGNFNGPNNIVAVFALSGTQVAPGAGAMLSALFTSGKISFYNAGPGLFNPRDPSTWGTGTPPLATYVLRAPDNTVLGPGGEPIFVPASEQNIGNVSNLNAIDSEFLATKLFDNLLVNPLADAGQFKSTAQVVDEGLLNPLVEGMLNAISMAFGQGPFSSPTDPFTPGSGGDVIENGGLKLNPLISPAPPPPPPIPEPASMMLWGLAAVGFGVFGGVRRYRRTKE